MPWLMQSPFTPPDATQTQRGVVGIVAQTFAGAKTFLATIVASAGIQLSSALFSTNGGSSSDVVIKAGTTLADASKSVGAKLLSLRTGIGGSEVEQFSVTAAGVIRCSSTLGTLDMNNSIGVSLSWNGVSLVTLDSNRAKITGALDVTAKSSVADGATAVAFVVETANTFANATAKLASFRNVAVEKAYVSKLGTLGFGTIPNSTGTPGAATQNGPKGRAAIAAAATSVVITNSEITADSVVDIIWEADPGARWWVAVAAGSFTVNLSAAPAGAVNFRWVAFK